MLEWLLPNPLENWTYAAASGPKQAVPPCHGAADGDSAAVGHNVDSSWILPRFLPVPGCRAGVCRLASWRSAPATLPSERIPR